MPLGGGRLSNNDDARTQVEHTASENINDLLYLMCVMIDTYCNAHAGQILLNQVRVLDARHTSLDMKHTCNAAIVAYAQSVRVRDFLYTIPWYRMDATLRKDMRFMLMVSSRPLQLTGGKFFVVNYESFVAVRLRHAKH